VVTPSFIPNIRSCSINRLLMHARLTFLCESVSYACVCVCVCTFVSRLLTWLTIDENPFLSTKIQLMPVDVASNIGEYLSDMVTTNHF